MSCANLVPTLPGGGALVVTRGGRNTESRCCPDAMERRRGDETKGSSLGPDGWGERMGSDGLGGGRRKMNCPREMCCCLVDDANWVTSQSATQGTLYAHARCGMTVTSSFSGGYLWASEPTDTTYLTLLKDRTHISSQFSLPSQSLLLWWVG